MQSLCRHMCFNHRPHLRVSGACTRAAVTDLDLRARPGWFSSHTSSSMARVASTILARAADPVALRLLQRLAASSPTRHRMPTA